MPAPLLGDEVLPSLSGILTNEQCHEHLVTWHTT